MLEDSFSFAIVNGRFPHVGRVIQEHWEDPAFAMYIEALLHRDSHRQGFPSDVARALYSLSVEHDVELPNLTCADRDF